MTSPLTLVCLITFAVAAYAEYGAQAPAATVVQVPYAAPATYNQPGYINVAPGHHHGPFFDSYASKKHYRKRRHGKKHHNGKKHHKKGHHKRHSSSDSWSGSGEHYGHHGGYGAVQYPGYWPGVYQDQVLSNPFYVPEGRRHRHRRKHHKHSKSSSSSHKSDSHSSSSSSSSGDRS